MFLGPWLNQGIILQHRAQSDGRINDFDNNKGQSGGDRSTYHHHDSDFGIFMNFQSSFDIL